MRYEIIIEHKEQSCIANTTVYNDSDVPVSVGKIEIGTSDEVIARQYAEEVFLPDLRVNFPKIASLVLPIDSAEVVEDVIIQE